MQFLKSAVIPLSTSAKERFHSCEQPTAQLSVDLKAASDYVKTQDCRQKVFDAFLHQQAINLFVTWAKQCQCSRH